MYITVAGNIGSGKTSLCELLSEHYGWKPLYENAQNPYLDDFYQDMNRWAFNLQIYFLGCRLKQLIEIKQSTEYLIQDRTIYEDGYIFAANLHDMGLMLTRDYEAYMEIFEMTVQQVRQPDVLIYLQASVPTLISQIQKRGRAYEMGIQQEYLERLNKHYENWIKTIYKGRVITIDMDKDDFILYPDKLDRIIERIDGEIAGQDLDPAR